MCLTRLKIMINNHSARLRHRKLRDLAVYQAAERPDRLGFSGVAFEGPSAGPKRI